LDQAARLLPAGEPGAVATRSLLALAHLLASQLPRFDELAREVDAQEPVTSQDFLFKGLLETMTRPERGLRTMDAGVRRHDSVLARATRLEARANRALVTGRVEDAKLALEDAQVARRMLAGNALILARCVDAHVVAAGCYQVQGRPEGGDRLLAEARPLFKELEPLSATPFVAKALFEYFDYVGEEEVADAVSGRANQFRRAVMPYRRGEFAKALDAAAERGQAAGPTQRIEPGLIVVELPDGPARARAAYEEVRASGGWPMSPPVILLLLGKPDEARQAYLQVHKEELPPWNAGWWSSYLDFSCGRITSDQLLQAAGEDRTRLGDAHFLIGMWRLSEGDRAAAREHFRKCVAVRVFDSREWPWVRAFLARMDKDPAWPRWIPPKK
jgi:tetratricopeptide (TPR) repeat protein